MRDQFINDIIEREGGYSNDPEDSGGETNFGITVRVARKSGYLGDMKDLPREKAFDIYVKKYWDSMSLDDVFKSSPVIAAELADTGVNCGVPTASIFLQRSLNVLNNREKLYLDIKVDGDVGSRTVGTLNTFIYIRKHQGIVVLHRMLNSLQGAHYVTLAERRQKDENFIFGWFSHRIT